MKNVVKLSLLVLLLVGGTSCVFTGVKGNGNVVSETRSISDDFVRIKASRGLDVYITKSQTVSLEVEADENLHELITTEVKNGTLIITSTKNIAIAKAKKIHLSVDHVNEILVSSGAEIYSENTFESEKLVIDVSSGAVVRMELEVGDLACESSSGADIRLSGKAENFRASSSSGSNIRAYDLATKHCVAKASSGSDIDIYVTESFQGKATSGADISYKGNPARVSQNDNSGGNVRKKS